MVEKDGNGEGPRDGLSGADQATEFLLMGLRLTEGVDLGRFEALSGNQVATGRLGHLQEIGMIWRDASRVGATREGRPLLNAVLREMLA